MSKFTDPNEKTSFFGKKVASLTQNLLSLPLSNNVFTL